MDLFIFVPQTICCLAGVVQLAFYLWITKRISSTNYLMRFLLFIFDRRNEKLSENANKKQKNSKGEELGEESELLGKHNESSSLRTRDTSKDEENSSTQTDKELAK
jgi:hypothetical protein